MVGQNEMPTRFDLRLMLHEQEKDINIILYTHINFLKMHLKKK